MHFSTILRKVQLPELLFLGLVATFTLDYLKQYRAERTDRVLTGVLGIYWLSNIISSVLSGEKSAIFESVGRLYLLVLFGMATLYFAQLSKTALRQQAANANLILAVLLALTALIVGIGTGNFVESLKKEQKLGVYPQNCPFLKHILRISVLW